jgi:hypothetical protein
MLRTAARGAKAATRGGTVTDKPTPASMPCLVKIWDHCGARRLISATFPTPEAPTDICLATAANGNPTAMNAQQYADMRGVVMCLACHDGAVAKGAMMQNWAFEEQIGALPSSYGIAKIPTLLGADGTTNLGSFRRTVETTTTTTRSARARRSARFWAPTTTTRPMA